MKSVTIDRLTPLLTVLRGYSTLREVRPTTFHLDGSDFVHFHERAGRVYADVRLAKGQVRMPATTELEQAELLERIDAALETLEAHAASKRREERE